MTPRTTCTATARLSQDDRDQIAAENFARMRENATAKYAKFVKRLTRAELEIFNALDPMARGMAALNGRLPAGEKYLPQSLSDKQRNARMGRKPRKDKITLESILAAAEKLGAAEFTATALVPHLIPKRGDNAIRDALRLYVADGKLRARQCGKMVRYSAVVKS